MLVSFDTEFKPTTDYVKVNPPTCVSYADDSGAGIYHARDPRAREYVAKALTHHISAGANIACDIATCCLDWPELIPLAWQAYADGRVMDLIENQRLIAIADGRRAEADAGNLADLSLLYGGPELDKDPTIRMGYGPLRDVPIDQWSERQRQYPIDDATAGRIILQAQPRPADWQNAARAAWCCFLMGAWGFRTDPERVGALKRHYTAQLQECIRRLSAGTPLPTGKAGKVLTTEQLLAAPLIRPNGDSWSRNTKAAQARMQAAGARRPTKGGLKLSLDEEACQGSGDPLLVAYAEYASLDKRLGTDIVALERGELHCWFKAVMTNNQTSCSSPYNAQNPPTSSIEYTLPDGTKAHPPGERECIVPRPGMCFIDADYNLFQLRTFSQVCLEIVGQSTMADILNDPKGPNIHAVTAAMILGIPISQFDKKADRELRGAKNAYDMAKRCNFGFGADMGCGRFQDTCSKQGVYVTEQEFYHYKNSWKRAYPESFLYFDYIQSLGHGAQITELFTGRKRGGCSYTDAANGYFSALAASAAKAAWFQIARECYDPSQGSILFGDRPVDFIHDQFIIESPRNAAAHDHAMRVKYLMETVTRPFLPDVPATTDPCLADCFSKKAESVFDSKGRLTVWCSSEVAA